MQNAVKHDMIKLSEEHIRKINAALEARLRVEIILTESGIKLYSVKRKELNKTT